MLASDALALAGITDRFIFSRKATSRTTPGGVRVLDRGGVPVERAVQTISAQAAVELGRTGISCKRRFSSNRRPWPRPSRTRLFDPVSAPTPRAFEQIDNVLILACGTSHYSADRAPLTAPAGRNDRARARAGRDRERIPLQRRTCDAEHAGGECRNPARPTRRRAWQCTGVGPTHWRSATCRPAR